MLAYEKSNDVLRGYEVDKAELGKVSDKIQPPAITGSSQHGWKLSAVTIHGWMHQKNFLSAIEFRISPNFEIAHSQTELSKRIFSAMPAVMY